ncbi:MAG: sugar phosphate isomerase/epimerase family protein [Bryobacteraceae bacterium]
MYVSLQNTLVAGRVPWPDFARLAHGIGFPGTDVATTPALAQGLEATRALLRELNLKPAVCGLPVEFRKDEATFQGDMAKLEDAVRFAAGIGCPRMSTYLLPSSDTPKPELRALLKKRFQAISSVLARSNVRLGLEYVSPVHLRKRFRHEFIWRMDEMLEFAKECGPNVGLLLDSWHWHHAGATVKDIVSAGKGNIVHVQVADSQDLPPEKILDNECLMPGEGVADLTGFFQALKKIGYEDGISPEIFGRGLKDMPPEQGATLGLETTMAVMRKAGVV